MSNPLFNANELDQGVWWNLFSTLWYLDETGQLIPGLAKEIPTTGNGGLSPDGRTWTIRLRDDVTWHDGTKFTADDVKYTIDLIKDSTFRGANRVKHAQVGDITVTSPTELKLTLKEAFAPYMSILAWTFMVPKHILGAGGDPNPAPFNIARRVRRPRGGQAAARRGAGDEQGGAARHLHQGAADRARPTRHVAAVRNHDRRGHKGGADGLQGERERIGKHLERGTWYWASKAS